MLERQWTTFREVESAESGKEASHLVSPGGSYDSAVGFLLHYPTYETGQVKNGKTYDPANSSIATLVGSGFTDENTLWFDMYCRRHHIFMPARAENGKKQRFVPFKHIGQATLNLHLEWANLVLRSMGSKVLVVFGKPNENFLMELWKHRLEKIQLWDEKSTAFFILYEPEDTARTRIEKIVFFLWHPEYVNRRMDPDTGRRYDEQLGIIARMGGIHQPVEQQRYQAEKSASEREKYHSIVGDATLRSVRLGVLRRTAFAVLKRSKGFRLEPDLTLDVACHFCGFVRVDVKPYFLKEAGYDFYVAAHGTCPVCLDAEEEKRHPGAWFLPCDRSLPWVKDKENHLSKAPSDKVRYWRDFTCPARQPESAAATARLAQRFVSTLVRTRGRLQHAPARRGLAPAGKLITDLGTPTHPAPKMIAGSEVWVRPVALIHGQPPVEEGKDK